ncbi:MAG: hypothetical protein HDS21_00195 [Bacteroides sp.]|nr:hypothetical protein [Bacteroides sp.]
MKTELTIEESTKLIELGVDSKLASIKEFVNIHPEVLKGNAEYAKPWGWFPKFRLEDILSILPKEIDGYYLNMSACMNEWYAYYMKIEILGRRTILHTNSSPELIDALYKLLIWVIEDATEVYDPT